jgi:hypothetical protein
MSDWPSFRCPGFSVPDQSHFFPIHLASEAATATIKLVVYLVGMAHLTLSFDGWSSKGHNEIYILSITTPAQWSFLANGLVLTGTSCSGETLFSHLSAVGVSILFNDHDLIFFSLIAVHSSLCSRILLYHSF